MKDQDNETRIDEDVEAHHNKPHVKTREDENDVEGHALNHTKSHTKAAIDEGDDDVEGHMNMNLKGHTKA
ncbi:MAG TPA: hypothetical protein VE055_03675 [Gaiellaceae bacterium]|jgi:hypothetical protein|nr:hypothetical protein [Gaiellaceae bacterium]